MLVAMKETYVVFRVEDVELSTCKERCIQEKACRGIYYYRVSHKCKGLSALGTVGIDTAIKADSYAKVHSLHPIDGTG